MELKEPIHHSIYRVIYGDTDTGGVVYYANYLRFFEIGRNEFVRSILKMSYRELEHRGLILPVTEVYCRYKSSAHYDDLLEISTSLVRFSGISMRFCYEIHCLPDYSLLVRGLTVHAATDSTGHLTRLPGYFQAALEELNIANRSNQQGCGEKTG
ncbi:MAG: YbgC/FadM family acyl-CoA thioesterase [Nitrospiraceae bacterium]|nr:YbgC/FadM family acyl-CoA thioesterase [Nitrospiraceae bacterium]